MHRYALSKQQQQGPAVLDSPKLIRNITIDRCSNFISGGANGNDINLMSQLYKARTNSEEHVSIWVYSVPDLKRITFDEAIQQEFRPSRLGEWFGPSWSTHWFHIQVRVPVEFAGEEVHFIWNADSEALIWDMDGLPLQGLTGGSGSDARHEYILTTQAQGGETIQFYIEMACNGMFGAGNGLIGPPDPNRFFNLNELDIAVPNKLAWQLLYDFQIILGMAKDLGPETLRASHAMYAANRIVNAFVPGSDDALLECLNIAGEFLSAKNGDAQHEIHAIGHCHIDTGWLWPFEETIRKAARSWSSQIDLMDRYPDYKFVCSQPQQYEWVMENYPSLWQRIREKVEVGQFVPTGGTWVEMDTNMPSGEALCRQFLLGQRFFGEHFGKRTNVFWLPDSFGYSPQLPQLLKLADMKYFFTQKLSWNNVNKFPSTTFWWIGLDGTRTLTHMAPSETYNAQCSPEELLRSVRNHRDKVYSNSSLLVYGNGDGGGGPIAGMIERLRRMRDLDGLAKVKMSTPSEFYEKVERDTRELSSWKGELYFELHRGIYTTHALCKKFNRSSELLLRDLEMLCALAFALDGTTYPYPKADFDQFWKMVCIIQFHDVLSGSAIEMVYDDCIQMYTKIDMVGKQMRDDLLEKLLHLNNANSMVEDEKALALINTLAWTRQEVIEVPLIEGLPTMDQYSAFGRSAYMLVKNIQPLGATGVPLRGALVNRDSKGPNGTRAGSVGSNASSINVNGRTDDESETQSQIADYEPVRVTTDADNNVIVENKYLQMTMDKSGHLIRLVDRALQRELIKPGERGNVFKMYEDIPLFWDAWDVEIYHLEKHRTVEEGSIQILEQGPLRASLLVEKTISDTSRLRQCVIMTATSRRIDFETEVDWNENRQFLKVEFAWDIMADNVAYETQYGIVQRPTHYNTSWDSAKFEAMAHKFADMSEYGYGVALLNDCKYGYSAHGNTLRLSLIRSPKAPDSNCDIGHHSLRYAIYPHEGHFMQSDVVREGYNFNVPLLTRVVPASRLPQLFPANFPKFRIEGARNVILDTIKKAEDSDALVLRLYEAYGGHASFRLHCNVPMKKIVRCNILEDESEIVYTMTSEVKGAERTFSKNIRFLDDEASHLQHHARQAQHAQGALLKIDPFQIMTLKVVMCVEKKICVDV
ncbi:glycosyl hydrolases family 38 N-terminal domain-containing protein [Gongronella butleri]|nr:glycosyl hydrolases family 38 N-terminal domain-containing protein [Gongronella butleri]